MEAKFWLDKWSTHTIGFHQNDINQHLKAYWQQLKIKKGSTVFVPLCGKSQDMNWIVEQGYSVIGVELSEIAITEFFEESKLEPQITVEGAFICYSSDNVTIYQGDIFDLTAEHLASCTASYDRASLIALPPKMRPLYCNHLAKILPAATIILLVTLEYDEDKLSGPPFSVSAEEISRLYNDFANIETFHKIPFDFNNVAAFAHTVKLTLN